MFVMLSGHICEPQQIPVDNSWMLLEVKSTKTFFLCAKGKEEVLDSEV